MSDLPNWVKNGLGGHGALIADPNHRQEWGLTLLELVLVIAIIGTLASIALPAYGLFIDKTKTARAINEISSIAKELSCFEDEGYLPASLDEIGRGSLKDPWGNPYQYNRLAFVPKGKWRKDRFLVPINSTFDLWSMGPDGRSRAPLTAKHSRDDIIRANDGGYVGPAKDY